MPRPSPRDTLAVLCALALAACDCGGGADFDGGATAGGATAGGATAGGQTAGGGEAGGSGGGVPTAGGTGGAAGSATAGGTAGGAAGGATAGGASPVWDGGCNPSRGSCSGGVDDDGDGLIDCDDADCFTAPQCHRPVAPGPYEAAVYNSFSDPYRMTLFADAGCHWRTSSLPASDVPCRWQELAPPASRLVLHRVDGGAPWFDWPVQRRGDLLFLGPPGSSTPLVLGQLTADAGPVPFFQLGVVEEGTPVTFSSTAYPVGYGIDLEALDRLVLLSNASARILGPATASGPGPLASDRDGGTSLVAAGYPVRFVALQRGRYTVVTSGLGLFGLSLFRFRADGRPYRYVLGSPIDVPGTGGAEAATVGDIDGDGRGDALIANSCQVQRLTPQPDGGASVQGWSINSFCSQYSATDVHVADLNRDGRNDVFVQVDGTVRSLLALPDGGFSPYLTGPFAGSVWPRAVPIDVNRDGLIDVALPSMGQLTVFTADGGGGWLTAGQYPTTSKGRHEVIGADLDGDGVDDVLTLSGQGGPPNLSFFSAARPPERTFDLAFAALVPGDFLCTGRIQLAWSSQALISLDGGAFQTLEPLDTYFGSFAHALDVDRDGRLDIVGVGARGPRVLSRREGRWSETEFPTRTGLNYNPEASAAGDFTGDGCPDVVIANYNIGASLYRGYCP